MSGLSPQSVKRTRAFTAWALIVGFLCQPILTYLVTPMQVTDKHGFTAVMCTLQGTREAVFVELPSISGEEAAPTDCSAIKLYQLAGTTQISLPVEAPAVVLYSVGLLDQTANHQHHSLHFSAYSSRAPPLA
jgi:hypothetical protein